MTRAILATNPGCKLGLCTNSGVKGGIIMYRRGGGERSRVALQNRTPPPPSIELEATQWKG